MMSFFKENSAKYHFNETQNVIVIATDGKCAASILVNVVNVFPAFALSCCLQVSPTLGPTRRSLS